MIVIILALTSPGGVLADTPPDLFVEQQHVTITTRQLTISGRIVSVGKEFISVKTEQSPDLMQIKKSAVETIQVTKRGVGGTAGSAPRSVLIYVHGICAHPQDFWADWWTSLQPYAPSIDPTTIEGVYWSDLVNDAPGAAHSPEQLQKTDSVKRIMEDRRIQESTGSTDAAPGGLVDTAIGCSDDFVKYMFNDRVRNDILKRFDSIIDKHLNAGDQIEIISHSWGTVIAYEGLRRKDGQTYPGKVHTLFTVGSALSIQPVVANLRTRIGGGKKPNIVSNWVNLDAVGDMVGGRISGLGFSPDVERLSLPAVGCSFIPLPTCAHSSYFVRTNTTVNRDVFGYFLAH